MMNLSRVTAYVQVARNIARKQRTSTVWILFRLRYCWHRYGFAYRDFIQFRFYSLPLSAPKAYIKKRELESLQALVNPEEARDVVDDKLKFFQRCQQLGLPTPTILGLVDSAQPNHSSDGIPLIRTPEHLLQIVRLGGEGKYLFKPARGFLGAGIKRIELKDDRLIDDSGEEIAIKEFLDSILEQRSLFILQKYLLPHSELRPIMPGGNLGTARILTIITGGEARVFRAHFKIPTGDNAADNFNSGQTGNLIAQVDLDSGRLLKSFGPDPKHSGLVDEILFHPDNGESLRGFKIPCWQELLATALNGARVFSDLGTIGWDIALTEEGPCLIEGNGRYGCEQAVVQRGQKAEFERLFNERPR